MQSSSVLERLVLAAAAAAASVLFALLRWPLRDWARFERSSPCFLFSLRSSQSSKTLLDFREDDGLSKTQRDITTSNKREGCAETTTYIHQLVDRRRVVYAGVSLVSNHGKGMHGGMYTLMRGLSLLLVSGVCGGADCPLSM